MKINDLNPNYTFENFIVGNNNRFAYDIALKVANNPANVYNPLFIYGDNGLEKTHLMQAIGNKILQNNPNFKICYMRIDELLEEIIKSIKEQDENNEKLLNKFNNIDVLMIDDIQFMASKKRCQEVFRNLFNKLYYDRKQIIIIGDKYPNQLAGIIEPLQTRFCWGNIVKIYERINSLEKVGEDIIQLFRNGSLSVIASRPSMGKSTLLLNMAKHYAVDKGTAIALFSLEMPRQSIIDKFEELSSENVFIEDTPAISVEEIKDKCANLKEDKDIGVVLIDYIQLVSTEKHNKSREQELAHISLELKKLAQEQNVPIIITSQLSKEAELRQDKRPILNDLRYNGSLTQDADVILFLYRDGYYNRHTDKNDMEVIIAKNRYGNTGTIKLNNIYEQDI